MMLEDPPLAGAQRRDNMRSDRSQHLARQRLYSSYPINRRAKSPSHGCWRTIAFLLFMICIDIGIVIGFIAYHVATTVQVTYASQVATLRDLLPPDNLKIYDSQGQLMDQLTDQGIHTEVNYAQIAPDLVNATVAIEDRTFWGNEGINLMSVLRAALTDLERGQPIEGGSTITQQLVKQLLVGSLHRLPRKLSEIILAPQVNNHYSKRDIMEMYLNIIYYGHQAYGIDAASMVYFGLED